MNLPADPTTTQEWTIRQARPDELDLLMALYDDGRLIMRQSGNLKQWTHGYPSRELIASDIARGYSHLCIAPDGQPAGVFALIPGQDPTYARIYQGAWTDDSRPYATLHRLSSRPGIHGVAQACIAWSFARHPNLRADTHRDNHIMQHVLTRQGFAYCGIIYLANGDERLAYQKCAPVPRP